MTPLRVGGVKNVAPNPASPARQPTEKALSALEYLGFTSEDLLRLAGWQGMARSKRRP